MSLRSESRGPDTPGGTGTPRCGPVVRDSEERALTVRRTSTGGALRLAPPMPLTATAPGLEVRPDSRLQRIVERGVLPVEEPNPSDLLFDPGQVCLYGTLRCHFVHLGWYTWVPRCTKYVCTKIKV